MWHRALCFLNLVETEPSTRLSWTQIGLVGSVVGNLGNIGLQLADQAHSLFTGAAAHPDYALLGLTTAAHGVAAVKAEMKRYTSTP